jgi:hypothetical protein
LPLGASTARDPAPGARFFSRAPPPADSALRRAFFAAGSRAPAGRAAASRGRLWALLIPGRGVDRGARVGPRATVKPSEEGGASICFTKEGKE